jgi:hypothetical protein
VPRSVALRHAFPALVAVVVSLLLAVLTAQPTGAVVVSGAGSIETRVASESDENLPPGDVAFPLGSDGFAKAQEVATAHWGAQPCNGQVSLTWAKLDPQTNGTASWKNPTDAWNNVAENFECQIELNTDAGFDFPKLCTVLAHEIGHLLGNQHAEQPDLLMSPYYSTALPECVAADPAPVQEEAAVTEALVVAKPAAARPKAGRSMTVKRSARIGRRILLKRKRLAFKRCVRRMRASGRTWRCRTLARRVVRLSRRTSR